MVSARPWKGLISASIAIGIAATFLALPFLTSATITDYTFGSETVNKGTSASSSNRNAEDSQYQTLTEADQYPNTNYSGSSENVVTGTAGGGSFPSSLDTDDSTRRSYTEANTAPATETRWILPDGDSQVQWDSIYPASPTTHYTKVYETGSSPNWYDGDTSYVYTATTNDQDRFTMSDITQPATGYNIDVQLFAVHKKTASQSANFKAGIRIGTTNYERISLNPTNGAWTNSSGTTDTTNPATSSEWTWTEVNALVTYIDTTDASPNPYCTKVVLRIYITYSNTYNLDAQITYSSVTSSSQTLSYSVFCQGYRSSSENFYVYAWDYTGSDWHLKTTIQAASDTDYDFALTSDERSSGSNEVKLRIVDATADDSTQDIVYFDVLKVTRIEKGFAADMELTASSIPTYGDMRLRIKGYTSAETFTVKMWVWGSGTWSSSIIDITALSNTWYSYDFDEATYKQGGQVKIRLTDGTAETADTTCDVLYLDVAWVSHYSADPVLNQDGCDPNPGYTTDTFHFWVVVTDADNQLPSSTYPKVDIEGTTYTMTENNSGDLDTVDGKAYFYDKSGLSAGVYDYFFITKDSTSSEVSSTPKQLTVNAPANAPPELSDFGRLPADPVYVETEFNFTVEYTDDDGDMPTSIRWREDEGATQNVTMYEVDAGDLDVTDGKMYYRLTVLAHGTHEYDYGANDGTVWVDGGASSVTINQAPVITNGPTAPHAYRNSAWEYDFDGNDPDTDSTTWERGGPSWLTINPSTGLLSGTTTNTPGSYLFTVYLNDTYGASDDYAFTLYIDNRAPVITSTGNTSQLWLSYFSYEIEATDADSDSLTPEISTDASFLALDGWYLNGTAETVGLYYIHLWVNDSYGGSDYEDWDLTVFENQAPYFTSEPDLTVTNGSEYEYLPTVTDPDSGPGPLVFSMVTNASWLHVNTTTGRINGTAAPPGTYWFNLTVSDGNKSISQNRSISVTEAEPVADIEIFLAVAVGLSTMALGLIREEYLFLSGLIWVFSAVMIFNSLSVGWIIISIGIGMVCMTEGGLRLAKISGKVV